MRARTIKPGFFKNEELAECSLAARLLFPGLWMLADREGRLEDRPKRIKGELFPYDDFDVDALLDELAGHGFITRYEAQGKRYIQIVTFLSHQRPHNNETQSEIPPCPEALPTMVESASNHGEKDLQPRTKALRSCILDPCILDPCVLEPCIPDSSSPDSDQGAEEEAETPNPKPQTQEEPKPDSEAVPTITVNGLKELWNEKLVPLGFPAVARISPAREKHFLARLADCAARASPGWWDRILAKIAASEFMRNSARDKKPWLCFDWILNEHNLVKVEEGKYSGGLYDANAPQGPRLKPLRDPDEILREFFGHGLSQGSNTIDTEAKPAVGGAKT
jgi:hypothetical protein